MLCGWAEMIVVMEPYMVNHIPPEHRAKTKVCDVGPDRYGQPLHPDLVAQVRQWAKGQRLKDGP